VAARLDAVARLARPGVGPGDPVRPAAGAASAPQAPITRFAFFGQLREGKGIRIFLDALERLGPPDDVIFLGRESKRWTREAILRLVPTARVETDLSREAALEELRTAGTLAVMPSLLDNSPNTVSECIENGIPFVSTNTGGIPELVAEQDRARVLCEPTAAALAERLGTALRDGFTPARPARAAQASVDAWLEVVDSVRPRPRVQMSKASGVSLVAGGPRAEARARAVATAVSTVDVEVVAAGSRREGLAEAKAPWIVFLDDEDELDDGLLDALVAAQAATQADIVTTAVRSRAGVRLFLGEPGAFGLLANHYGVVGLVRRELLSAHRIVDDGPDPDWPLFARLALAGARIVSVPEPLATHAPQPGQVGDVPGQALRVLDAFEAAGEVRDLPQLAATLAAAYARTARASGNALPREGRVAALARRARARLS
jgi:hypothetical protein